MVDTWSRWRPPEWYQEPGTRRWKKIYTTPEGDIRSVYETPPRGAVWKDDVYAIVPPTIEEAQRALEDPTVSQEQWQGFFGGFFEIPEAPTDGMPEGAVIPPVVSPPGFEAPLDIGQILETLFPGRVTGVLQDDLKALEQYINNAPESFLEDIQAIGRTSEAEVLLRGVFPQIAEEDLLDIFGGELLDIRRETAQWDKMVADWKWGFTKLYGGEGLKGKASDAFIAGVGDMLTSVGGAASWLGYEDVGGVLSSTGSDLQRTVPPAPVKEFEAADLLDPEFYATKVVRTLPFALSIAPVAIGGFYGIGAVATAAGLGTIGSWIVSAIGSGVLSRSVESAMEAGGSYGDAIARGKTPKEAEEEANEVFRNNMILAGADAWEIAIALAPTPKWVPASLVKSGLVRTARVAGKMVIVGLSEGGEELYQDMVQRHARGEEWQLDAVSKEVFAIGMVMGLGMGFGGDVITSFVGKAKENMTPAVKKDFNDAVSRFEEQGIPTGQSELMALDEIAQIPEGKQAIEEAFKEVERVEQLPIKPKVTPEGSGLPVKQTNLALNRITREVDRIMGEDIAGVFEINLEEIKIGYVDDLVKLGANEAWAKSAVDDIVSQLEAVRTVPIKPIEPKVTPEAPRMTRREELQLERDIANLKRELETAPIEEREGIQRRITILEGELARGEALVVPEAVPEVVPPPVEEIVEEAPPPVKPMPKKPSVPPVEEVAPADMVKAEEMPLGRLTIDSLTTEQVDLTLKLFSQALVAETTEVQRAATMELRKRVLAERVANLQVRIEELLIEGKTPQEAIKQAQQETMSGKLPELTTEYFSDFTEEMRTVLYAKVYQEFKNEPFELMSTTEALTNAIRGQSIPRKKGTGTAIFPEGGSAFDRLSYVFVGHPEIVKALDQGKPLIDVVEAVFRESPSVPVELDQVTVDYLRGLSDIPRITEESQVAAIEKQLTQFGFPNMMEVPWTPPSLAEIRTISEREYALIKLNLDTALAERRITKDTYDIELAIARQEAYPHPPVAKFEQPISDAFKALPLLDIAEKQSIVRILKEAGLVAVDIGNFIRANKASFDFSFWRQAKLLASGHPIAMYKANVEAFKALFSQKSAEAAQQLIERDADFQIYEEIRLKTGADPLRLLVAPKGTAQYRAAEEFGHLTEERLIPRITAWIPWIKISGRSFVTGTNKMVWEVWKTELAFKQRYEQKIASGQIKLKEGEAFSIWKEMAEFQKMLANMIQRGSLGKATVFAPEVGATFFAARSKVGRFLAPFHLISKNKRVRQEAWKDFTLLVAYMGGLAMLGKWLDLWDVEEDPRNAEFMSIRIGNMRIDPWSGYRQFLVLYTRLITGTGVSSVTGAEYETDPIRALTTFVRTSLSPLASILADFWTGKNFLGEEVEVTNMKQWIERVSPFSIWDVWEAFEDSVVNGWISVLPAIIGEGVQTYTGDWVEDWANLGLPKFMENVGYGINEPYYDTADFWGDTVSQFKDVDPATLTERKGFPDYIRAIIEAKRIKEQLTSIPNEKLTSINADPNEGATFVDYYKMWQEREKLVASGDEERLKEFDASEITRRAFMGNITQTQYALLTQYHLLPKDQQKDFLEEHPEIGINPRLDWLKSHPSENAQLAIWGQAKILSLEAYKEFNELVKELDIPQTAIPILTLPPETSIETHFAYEDLVEEGKHGSWEAQLLLLEDAEAAKKAGVESYAEWHDLKLSETSMRSLDLKIKHRSLSEEYEALGDNDSPLYIEDDTAREEARNKLRDENPQWVDDMRRVEAIEHEASEKITESWVERGKLVDEFSGGSSEAKVWLLDNPEVHKWALEQGLLSNDGSGWDERILRLNMSLSGLDEESDEYHRLNYTKGAYEVDFSENLINTYVDWYMTPRKDYEDDWFLMENMDFYKEMLDKGVFTERRDFRKVPSRKVYDLYLRYLEVPRGSTRIDFRRKYPDLDDWLVLAKDYKPVEGEVEDKEALDMWEKLAKKAAGI